MINLNKTRSVRKGEFRLVLSLLLFIGGVVGLSAQVKIGENVDTVHPYAILELESNSLGLVLPQLTDKDRDSAFDNNNNPIPEGMVIYNTTQNRIQYWDGTSWKSFGSGQGVEVLPIQGPPAPPAPGSTVTNTMVVNSEGDTYVYDKTDNEWKKVVGAQDLTSGVMSAASVVTLTLSGDDTPVVMDLSSLDEVTSAAGTPTLQTDTNTVYVDESTGIIYTYDGNEWRTQLGKEDEGVVRITADYEVAAGIKTIIVGNIAAGSKVTVSFGQPGVDENGRRVTVIRTDEYDGGTGGNKNELELNVAGSVPATYSMNVGFQTITLQAYGEAWYRM